MDLHDQGEHQQHHQQQHQHHHQQEQQQQQKEKRIFVPKHVVIGTMCLFGLLTATIVTLSLPVGDDSSATNKIDSHKLAMQKALPRDASQNPTFPTKIVPASEQLPASTKTTKSSKISPNNKVTAVGDEITSIDMGGGFVWSQIAQIAPHFKNQLLRTMTANPDLYTEAELNRILTVLHFSTAMMSSGRTRSGKGSISHLIGTTSCCLAEHLSSEVLELSLAHTYYNNFWSDFFGTLQGTHAKTSESDPEGPFNLIKEELKTKESESLPTYDLARSMDRMKYAVKSMLENYKNIPDRPNDQCEMRRMLVSKKILAPKVELLLWRFHNLQAHGSPHAPELWQAKLLSDRNFRKAEANNDKEGMARYVPMDDIEKEMIVFGICDELDEHFNGEQLWVPWKDRTDDFYHETIHLAEKLGAPRVAQLARDHFAWTKYASKMQERIKTQCQDTETTGNPPLSCEQYATMFRIDESFLVLSPTPRSVVVDTYFEWTTQGISNSSQDPTCRDDWLHKMHNAKHEVDNYCCDKTKTPSLCV